MNASDPTLLTIYLSGFRSGLATALGVVVQDPARLGAVTAQMMAEMQADPLVMEALRTQITEILAGQDSGPVTIPRAIDAPSELYP